MGTLTAVSLCTCFHWKASSFLSPAWAMLQRDALEAEHYKQQALWQEGPPKSPGSSCLRSPRLGALCRRGWWAGRFCELAAGTALSHSPLEGGSSAYTRVLCLHQVTGGDSSSVNTVLTLGWLASRVDLNVYEAERYRLLLLSVNRDGVEIVLHFIWSY